MRTKQGFHPPTPVDVVRAHPIQESAPLADRLFQCQVKEFFVVHLDLPGSYAAASMDTSAETDAKASKDFRKSVAGVISDKYAAHGLPGFANRRRRTPQHRLRGVLRG